MPKLTVTNLTPPGVTPAYLLADICIQDPFPAEGRLVLQIPAGATKSIVLEMGQLQRIKPLLVAAQQAGGIQWSVEATDEDPRAEEADLMGGPVIDVVDTGTTPITAGAANIGSVATGSGLLMGMVQSIRRLFDPATPLADYLDIQAIDPGIAGDDIGVVLINDAAVVDPSNIEYAETLPTPAGYSRVLEIHVLPATFTWVTLATILNDGVNGIVPRTALFLAGSFRLQSGANAGAVNNPTDQALGSLAGGEGVPLMLNIGDTPAVITQLTDVLCRFDVDLTGSTMLAHDSFIARLRSSGGGPSALFGGGLA